MEQHYKILPCGDSSVSIQLGDKADIPTNTKVRNFDLAIQAAKVKGITETVPTYRAVMVHYDPLILSYGELKQVIDEIGAGMDWDALQVSTEVIRIPVYYTIPGGELEQIAAHEGKTPEEIIRIHSQQLHYVFMLGFSPGSSYIGCPGGSFTIKRKATPTDRPFSKFVGIQTDQTAMSAFGGSTGWWAIGRTPLMNFDMRKKDPFLFRPGQWVEFYPIEQEEFDAIEAKVDDLTYEPEIYHLDQTHDFAQKEGKC